MSIKSNTFQGSIIFTLQAPKSVQEGSG